MSNSTEIVDLVRQDIDQGTHHTFEYFLNEFSARNGSVPAIFTEAHHSLVHIEIENEILKDERVRVSLHQVEQVISLRGLSICRVQNGQHTSELYALSTIPRHPHGSETQLVGHPPTSLNDIIPVTPEQMGERIKETLEMVKPGRWRLI